MSGSNWTGLLGSCYRGWSGEAEYHSELGPKLAGVSQHAWGAWSEGLHRVRETHMWVIPPGTYTPDQVSSQLPVPSAGRGASW